MYKLYFEYAFADKKVEPLKLEYKHSTFEEAQKFMKDMVDGFDTMGKALGQKNSVLVLKYTAQLNNYGPKGDYWGLAMWGILPEEES